MNRCLINTIPIIAIVLFDTIISTGTIEDKTGGSSFESKDCRHTDTFYCQITVLTFFCKITPIYYLMCLYQHIQRRHTICHLISITITLRQVAGDFYPKLWSM